MAQMPAAGDMKLIAGAGLRNGTYVAGLDIAMPPGSHTYWKMPGDAGVPPVFSFDGSTNVRAARVLFPTPKRLSEDGLEAFGYLDRVLFPVEIAPADPAKPAELRVDATYAVCNKICIPAHAKATVTLSPKAGADTAATDAAATEAALAAVPAPATSGERAELSIVPEPGAPKPTWMLAWHGAKPIDDVFADAPDGYYFSTRKTGDPDVAARGRPGARHAGRRLAHPRPHDGRSRRDGKARHAQRDALAGEPPQPTPQDDEIMIKEGDIIPDATFTVLTPDGPAPRTSEAIFADRKVVLIGVPGAFTPTCSMNHLPGFIEHAAAMKEKGVDEVLVTGVNDVFVMGAWAKSTGGEGKVTYLADGSAKFAQAIGAELDLTDHGPRRALEALLDDRRGRRGEEARRRGEPGPGRRDQGRARDGGALGEAATSRRRPVAVLKVSGA